MNVYIRKNTSYYFPIIYVLKLIEKNREVKFDFLDNPRGSKIIWDHKNDNSQIIAIDFYKYFNSDHKSLKHNKVFTSSPNILDNNGKIDTLATIFYMINSLQELEPNDTDLDDLGRFKFLSSYQYRFNNINENLVESIINDFCEAHSIIGKQSRSVFFISHDIDNLYGSILEDGFWAIKQMKIGTILNLIILEMTKNPHWRNIDKIIKINNSYDIVSTFFWLVNRGKSKNGISNADYNLEKENNLVAMVEESNNINGLHKSAFAMSIDQELKKGNLSTKYNRYHYLKFLPHEDYKNISESSLTFDSSLGFAEHYGFRNSYGKSFQPFDIKNNKPYNFIETPLNCMDRTFHKYMNMNTSDIGDLIINIYENNPTNCDISLLWHNNYFTDYKYKNFLKEYKKVLAFIYESKIKCVSPNELVKSNTLEW